MGDLGPIARCFYLYLQSSSFALVMALAFAPVFFSVFAVVYLVRVSVRVFLFAFICDFFFAFRFAFFTVPDSRFQSARTKMRWCCRLLRHRIYSCLTFAVVRYEWVWLRVVVTTTPTLIYVQDCNSETAQARQCSNRSGQ